MAGQDSKRRSGDQLSRVAAVRYGNDRVKLSMGDYGGRVYRARCEGPSPSLHDHVLGVTADPLTKSFGETRQHRACPFLVGEECHVGLGEFGPRRPKETAAVRTEQLLTPRRS